MKASWTEKSAIVATALLAVATMAGVMLAVNCLNISKADIAEPTANDAVETVQTNENEEVGENEIEQATEIQNVNTEAVAEATTLETTVQTLSTDFSSVTTDDYCTVTFDSNGGIDSNGKAITFDSMTVMSGSTIKLPQVTEEQLGVAELGEYYIQSWTTTEGTKTETLEVTETPTVTEKNVTFVAQWTDKAQQCNNNINDPDNPQQHKIKTDIITNATCSATGLGNQVCTVCGAVIKTGITIAKTAHSYNFKDDTGLKYNDKSISVMRCENDITHVAEVGLLGSDSTSDIDTIAAGEGDLYMNVNDMKTFSLDSSYSVSIPSSTGSACEAALNKDSHTITFTAKANGQSNFLLVGEKSGKKYLTVIEVFVGNNAFSDYKKALIKFSPEKESIYIYSVCDTLIALDNPITVGTSSNTYEKNDSVDDKGASIQEETEENEDKSTVNQPIVVASEKINTSDSSQMTSLPQAGDNTAIPNIVFWSIVFVSSLAGLRKVVKQ